MKIPKNIYLINVTGCGWMWINQSTCQDNICSTVFSNCTEYVREIKAKSWEQAVYPTSVGRNFNLVFIDHFYLFTDYYNQYFWPAVNQSSRCQIHVQCLPIIHRYFRGNQMCTIRYTIQISNSIMNPIGIYHTWFYVLLWVLSVGEWYLTDHRENWVHYRIRRYI